MAIAFRRRRRLSIEYIQQHHRLAYVIDFKGKEIHRDANALCYLRACKEVLRHYLHEGEWCKMPGIEEKNSIVAPFIVYTTRNELVTVSLLLRYSEEIHSAAERIHNDHAAYLFDGGSNSITSFEWRLR